MEMKLQKLFDYQGFEDNPRLAKLIAQTEARCSNQLSDEDLCMVNAAGDINIGMDKKNGTNTDM